MTEIEWQDSIIVWEGIVLSRQLKITNKYYKKSKLFCGEMRLYIYECENENWRIK